MKLIFTRPEDCHDTYGRLHFGANGLRILGRASGLPAMRPRCAVPQPDGSYLLYGGSGGHDEPWRIFRARTFDGLHYEGAEVVFQSDPGPWLGEMDIAHNTLDGSLLCLKWHRGDTGHALFAFGSEDGSAWRPLAQGPVYLDHDAFGLMWDPRTQRYICYQTTYQRWQKRYEDNIGSETRRVLHIRTSPDGVTWDPREDVPWAGPHMRPERLMTPDDHDPGEIEFYRFCGFPYADRYAGMMLIYCPSPHPANPRFPWDKHGPHLSGEWWISGDGMQWARPFREVFGPGQAPGAVEYAPMTLDGHHLWVMGKTVCALPEDRLFYVGSRANAELSTVPFAMSKGPLTLNASLGFDGDEHRGMMGQGYIMAELLREDGSVAEGFEKERCVLPHVAGNTTQLLWGHADGSAFAGQTIRLRLHFRDARIYSLTT